MATEEKAEDKGTQRVVLCRYEVLVLPEGMTKDTMVADQDLHALVGEAVVVEAWVVVGEFEGATKKQAIEAYAGKPNTPDAKAGTYKAPTASAWSGGRFYSAPPQPLVQAGDIE